MGGMGGCRGGVAIKRGVSRQGGACMVPRLSVHGCVCAWDYVKHMTLPFNDPPPPHLLSHPPATRFATRLPTQCLCILCRPRVSLSTFPPICPHVAPLPVPFSTSYGIAINPSVTLPPLEDT